MKTLVKISLPPFLLLLLGMLLYYPKISSTLSFALPVPHADKHPVEEVNSLRNCTNYMKLEDGNRLLKYIKGHSKGSNNIFRRFIYICDPDDNYPGIIVKDLINGVEVEVTAYCKDCLMNGFNEFILSRNLVIPVTAEQLNALVLLYVTKPDVVISFLNKALEIATQTFK